MIVWCRMAAVADDVPYGSPPWLAMAVWLAQFSLEQTSSDWLASPG